jgi:protein disulfide-isomerase A6
MRFSIFFSVVVPIVAYSTSNNLVLVNDGNFKEIVVHSGKYTFVDFYADWCRHCKTLMPTIEELAEVFSDYDDIQIVKVNGDGDGKRMGRKYVTQGFPTMLLFHGEDDPVEFDGVRDLKSISNFIQLASGVKLDKPADSVNSDNKEKITENLPPVSSPKVVLLGDDNFDENVIETNKPTVVAFGATWCKYCQDIASVIESLARIYSNENIQIAKMEIDTKPADVIFERYDVENLPTIMFFNAKGNKEPIVFRGSKNLKKLVPAINQAFGVSRDESGRLMSGAGTIQDFDLYFSQELQSDADIEFVATKAIEKLPKENENSFYYKQILNQISRGDDGSLTHELYRITSILSTDFDKLSSITVDSLEKRRNVLQQFIGALNEVL